MKFEIKKVCDFDFIKIGEAYLAEKPLKASGISTSNLAALRWSITMTALECCHT